MADTAPVTSTQTAAPQAPAAAPTVESAPPKVKIRKHKQRSCDEKDAKGKVCAGHLKRWYDYPPEVVALIGPKAEIYRCRILQDALPAGPGAIAA